MRNDRGFGPVPTSHKSETPRSQNGATDAEFNALRAFHAVIEHGSISTAARELDWPKSTLSRRLQALEKQLGYALINRRADGVRLTEAGRCYAKYCEQILHLADEGHRALAATSTDIHGTIRIRISQDLNWGWITRALNQFLATYPKVTLDIQYSHCARSLEEEHIDLWVWTGHEPDTKLHYVPIGRWRRKVYAAATSAFNGRPIDHPSDLLAYPWIAKSEEKGGLALSHASGESYYLDHGNTRFQAENIHMLADSISLGYGLGILPTWCARCHVHGKPGAFTSILDGWSALPIPIALLYPAGPRAPRVDMLLRHLRDTVPPNWQLPYNGYP